MEEKTSEGRWDGFDGSSVSYSDETEDESVPLGYADHCVT